jgi:uncharacterized protein YebE (UPF0316 family)
VSLSTIRVVFTARGEKQLAACTGFFEVLLWLIIIKQLFSTISNPVWYIAYAAGYGLGTYLGMYISEKLSVGRVIIRIITRRDATKLIKQLRAAGYGVTIAGANAKDTKSKIIFSVIHSRDIAAYTAILLATNPKAFYTIEDVRKVNKGKFKSTTRRFRSPFAIFANVKRK